MYRLATVQSVTDTDGQTVRKTDRQTDSMMPIANHTVSSSTFG